MTNLTFDQVYAVTDKISDVRSFSENEARCYWGLLTQLPAEAVVVEIGLQWGRSSSLVAQAALAQGFMHIGIDPFVDPPEARLALVKLMDRFGHKFILVKEHSQTLHGRFHMDVDLALIDGDHSPEGVENDVRLLMPLVKPGGYLLFHDYGVSLPNVYPSVEPEFVRLCMPREGWVEVGTVDTLGVWRKL